MSDLTAPTICSECGSLLEQAEVPDADGRCELCQAVERLRFTLLERGLMKPDLFDSRKQALPPGDRD